MTTRGPIVFGFSHILGPGTSHSQIVFGFSHTLGPGTLALAQSVNSYPPVHRAQVGCPQQTIGEVCLNSSVSADYRQAGGETTSNKVSFATWCEMR